MPRNGTGTYSLPEPSFVSGTVISSAAVNDDLSDIATALTGSLPRDGQAGMIGQFKAIDGSVAAPSISFNNEHNTGFFRPAADQIGVVINGVQVTMFNSTGLPGLLPVGLVCDFAVSSAPALWLLCYGQAVSRTTYSALFAVIGTNFGSGDGSTTFNVPDLRGTIIAGLDNMGGSAAGRLTTTYFGTDPAVDGNRGGSQSTTLTLNNVPIGINSSGTNSISVSGLSSSQFTQGLNSIVAGAGGLPEFGVGSQGFVSTSSSGSNSISVTSTNTGGTAFSTVQPTMVMAKMIYAGV